jgi:hypothetical protein
LSRCCCPLLVPINVLITLWCQFQSVQVPPATSNCHGSIALWCQFQSVQVPLVTSKQSRFPRKAQVRVPQLLQRCVSCEFQQGSRVLFSDHVSSATRRHLKHHTQNIQNWLNTFGPGTNDVSSERGKSRNYCIVTASLSSSGAKVCVLLFSNS